MTTGALYTSSSEILSRLSARLRTSGKIISPRDVKRWCFDVEKIILGDVDNFPKFYGFPLRVKDHQAWLPCNVYRILNVYSSKTNSGSHVNYNNLDTFLSLPSTYTSDTVYIDYYGSPVDLKTGDAKIIQGHELAAVAYCQFMLFSEDIIMDRISIDSKNRITAEKDNELTAALSWSVRHKDRMALNRDDAIWYDELPMPARLQILGLE